MNKEKYKAESMKELLEKYIKLYWRIRRRK